MNLLSITNRYYLISLSLFFIFAGVLLFYAISYNMNEELDEQLYAEQIHVENAIKSMDHINATPLSLLDNIIVKKTSFAVNIKPEIFDSLIYDDVEKEMIPFRLIRFSAQTTNANYVIVIKESKIETSDLVISIFFSLMLVFGLFCLILYVANSYLNRKIWSPFLETISAIKTLNINNRDVSFKYQTSHIEEFNELNFSLQKMIERIESDYLHMKEFSENAAHELQTPLSIIRSKLESLLQSKDLNNEDAQLIDQALESTVRLSRLNQSLLLLTKIENRQYEQKQEVSFSSVFDKYIEFYNENILENGIEIQLNKYEDFVFEINPTLADLLISNLLSNAIKHNIQDGEAVINIEKGRFEIFNTGEEPTCSTELFFNRFKKGNHLPEHLGLGLALVKEIVETSGLQITYIYENDRHLIMVKKN
ncbi:MAG: HAMP domain-containing sensor histidine kinase [Bacteroidales bacterium]|nr:HAMP domain-containing sensor histidine kinase [Bacteroidales bacterium]MDD4712544.1 HAMP domain-containing sensor histidine kinase [Bacteroidales bacterium]